MDLFQKKHISFFWLGLLLLTLFLRMAAFYTPILDVDETQFAGFAHVLMEGGLPYLDSVDTKPLGIYLFYALVFILFGKFNMIAVHVVTALIAFATAWFLSRIFSLWNRPRAGYLAALFFIVFSTTFVPKYISTSINSIMVFFLVVSVYFMARATKKHVHFDDFLAGIFLGLAFLFKYTAGIQGVLFLAFTFILFLRGLKFLSFLRRNILFGLGFFLPLVFFVILLMKIGVWDAFVEWSLKGSGQYIAQGGASILFAKSFLIRFGGFVIATFFLWFYGFRDLKKSTFQSSLYLLLVLWFGLTLIPVCMGGRFYPHYFIPLLPSLCGLAAYAVSLRFGVMGRVSKKVLIGLIVVPMLFFWVLRIDYQTFLKHFPDDAIYEQERIGLHLKGLSQPDDTVFVWGFATGIYFHSELKPASRFLWADLLTGRTPGPEYAREIKEQEKLFKNPKAWALFWEDVNNNPPTYFVNTSPADIHGYARFPVKNYPGLHKFIQKNYVKVDNFEGVDVYVLKAMSDE